MNGERITFSRRRLLVDSIFGWGLSKLVGLPLLHPERTYDVYKSAFTGVASCDENVESLDPNYPFDVIAVPGAGSINKNGTFSPNPHGALRLEAAAIAYHLKLAPSIILLDGKADPKAHDANVTALQAAYEKLAGEGQRIPEDHIFTDRSSTNTATNIGELKEAILENGWRNVLMESNKSHIIRAASLSCARGIPTGSVTAESLFERLYPGVENGLPDESFFNDPFNWAKEHAEVILLAWDPNGNIPTLASKIIN